MLEKYSPVNSAKRIERHQRIGQAAKGPRINVRNCDVFVDAKAAKYNG